MATIEFTDDYDKVSTGSTTEVGVLPSGWACINGKCVKSTNRIDAGGS